MEARNAAVKSMSDRCGAMSAGTAKLGDGAMEVNVGRAEAGKGDRGKTTALAAKGGEMMGSNKKQLQHATFTNNDVNMQGTRHCNRHQQQKQQQDQRVKRRDRCDAKQPRLEARGAAGQCR